MDGRFPFTARSENRTLITSKEPGRAGGSAIARRETAPGMQDLRNLKLRFDIYCHSGQYVTTAAPKKRAYRMGSRARGGEHSGEDSGCRDPPLSLAAVSEVAMPAIADQAESNLGTVLRRLVTKEPVFTEPAKRPITSIFLRLAG
jgi:hypothetical protein